MQDLCMFLSILWWCTPTPLNNPQLNSITLTQGLSPSPTIEVYMVGKARANYQVLPYAAQFLGSACFSEKVLVKKVGSACFSEKKGCRKDVVPPA